MNIFKKIFKIFDKAAKNYQTKCDACGTVMQGRPQTCERCGAALIAGGN